MYSPNFSLIKTTLLLVFVFYFLSCHSQNSTSTYIELIDKAYKAYKEKKYREAAELNTKAYRLPNEPGVVAQKYLDAYNAACCWALINQLDSAFSLLFEITNNDKYSDYKTISTDKDLVPLHKDARWQKLLLLVENNSGKKTANVPGLKERLDSLYQKDQELRVQIFTLQKTYSSETDQAKKDQMKRQLKDIAAKMKTQDSSNLIFVTDLLEKHGWPDTQEINFNGSQALFLVIQHADLATQKKFLPVVESAVKEGKTLPSNLAILKDRIGIREKGEQLYGSQIWTDPKTQVKYVDVLADPDNVDKRREEVGLPTMAVYLKQFFQMEWNAEDYKNNILPKLKLLKKKQ